MVRLHEVTPLSRMLALFLFVAVIPGLSFYVGTVYEDTIVSQQSIRTYDFPALLHYPASDLPETASEPSDSSATASTSAGYTVEHI